MTGEMSMANGDLPFDVEAKPAHERTLERILYLAERGFDDVPEERRSLIECVTAREICFRVVGTLLPEDQVDEDSEENYMKSKVRTNSSADTLADAISKLNKRCIMSEANELLNRALSWVVRTYLV